MSRSSRSSVRLFGRRGAVLVTSLTVIIATLGLAAAPAMAASKTPFNTNLVKNPRFEAGGASADGNSPVFIPKWTSYGNATVVKYGTPGGFPTAAQGRHISGGKNFFTTGQYADGCGSAWQEITIRGRDAEIDAASVNVVVTARLGTYGQQTDRASVSVETGPGDSATYLSTRATNGRMQRHDGLFIMTPGRRSMRINLYATDTTGYCDAYFDNISVKLVLRQDSGAKE